MTLTSKALPTPKMPSFLRGHFLDTRNVKIGSATRHSKPTPSSTSTPSKPGPKTVLILAELPDLSHHPILERYPLSILLSISSLARARLVPEVPNQVLVIEDILADAQAVKNVLESLRVNYSHAESKSREHIPPEKATFAQMLRVVQVHRHLGLSPDPHVTYARLNVWAKDKILSVDELVDVFNTLPAQNKTLRHIARQIPKYGMSAEAVGVVMSFLMTRPKVRFMVDKMKEEEAEWRGMMRGLEMETGVGAARDGEGEEEEDERCVVRVPDWSKL
ncbi:hypothetical protein K402DRAFT_223283 [Aulographum hederae CBS 113979]|uniref:Uncharacterized protein n=1 Tax=Aulographum hederae CBS 113979 TaxID=1176131 RepID=A0A6G1GLH9_9PEZI|nr:hypothetical protein K402DRAFT_223283 [Aulographum hederae CBS 113979]